MKRSGGRDMEQPSMGLSIRASVETQAKNHRHGVIGVRDTEPKELGLVFRFKPLLISRSNIVHFVGSIEDIKNVSASEDEPRHKKDRYLEEHG